MATLGHSICPILGGQALSTGSNRNDSWFTLGHMSSQVLTLLELEQLEWGVGRGRVTSQQQHLTPERVLVGGCQKGQQQLGPGEEAHLLLSPSYPHVTDEEMQTQRHRFTCPRSHSNGTARAWTKAAPSLLFSGSDRVPGPEVERSKYFSCSNAKSKTETLIDLTASQVLSPT